MKILNLYAENLKRLSVVEITPDGNLVEITGKNGQGKTSVLDAIWWALDGTKNVQTTPIRKGEETALIKLDLGELKITRKFIAQEDGGYTTSIIVANAEGARFQSPQSMLDDLLGKLTFDPLAFTRMKSSDQVLSLQNLVPDFDFEMCEKLNKDAFQERTDVNRAAKTARTNAETLSAELPEIIPEAVSVETLMTDWQDAKESNQTTEDRATKRANYIEKRDVMIDQVEELQKAIKFHDDVINKWEELPEIIDAEAIRVDLNAADSINKIATKAAEREEHLKAFKSYTERAEELTTEIMERNKSMKDAIAQADMPVDGLAIEDETVYLDGIPFDQASDAQQLQASIGVAMALNPTLKVIRVRDGSLLDEDAMKVLADMAEARDYQIWIERVDSTGEIGFVLEDGHIKGQVVETDDSKEPVKIVQSGKTKSMFDGDTE